MKLGSSALSLAVVVAILNIVVLISRTNSPAKKAEREGHYEVPLPSHPVSARSKEHYRPPRNDPNYVFSPDTWKPGLPHPIEPQDTSLPPSGKATTLTLLGRSAKWHIDNAVVGLGINPDAEVIYEITDGKTRVTFPPTPTNFDNTNLEWTIEIDNATGKILVPTELPPLSDEQLTNMTWQAFTANNNLERLRAIYREISDDGTVIRELSDVQCDEIRRIGDKAVVMWLLVESPPYEEPGCIRPIYWVDVRTRKIIHFGYERWENR
jgi:hypothetical protein